MVSVNINIYSWSLYPVTTDSIMRVNVRTITTPTTTTSAAPEARNLKTAYLRYISLTTTIPQVAAVSLISTPRVDPFSEKELPRNPRSKIVLVSVGSAT